MIAACQPRLSIVPCETDGTLMAGHRAGRGAGSTRVRRSPSYVGAPAEGIDVSKLEDYDNSVKALHRMIAYIRDEAMRLRIADVAILLERAEDAVISFVPNATTEQDTAWTKGQGISLVEH